LRAEAALACLRRGWARLTLRNYILAQLKLRDYV
jgi:hypothetical protein